MNTIEKIISEFAPITLEEMDEVKLMNRTDTKFIFSINQLPDILHKAKQNYKVLEINKNRILDYKTLYFDTEDLRMYNLHQNGKLNRYKIRHREYLVSNISFLEIKFKSNKGRTIKKRIKKQKIEEQISPDSKKFIEENTIFNSDSLKPALYNKFSRITLTHNTNKERVTIDINLKYNKNEKKTKLPFLVIAEVKQEGFSNASEFIKILKSQKIRPTGMSKYCVGTVLMNKNIKYNNFKTKLLTLKKINNNDKQFVEYYS